MKFRKRCLALFMAVVMVFSLCYVPKQNVTASTTNLVTNGGFEDGLTGWDNFSSSPKFEVTTEVSEVYDGNATLKVTSSSQDWVGLTQDVFVTPDTDYTLTFYGKNVSMFCYKIMDQSWSSNLVEEYPTGTGEFTRYTATFNSASNTKVILYISDSGTDGFYDDFSILASSPAATEYVVNGGFEDDLTAWDNWSASPKFEITTEAADVYQGSKALKVTSSSQDWVGLSQDIFVQQNTDYLLSFYGKNTSMFCYKVIDESWSNNLVEQYPTGTGEYTRYTATFNSGSNSKVVLYISDSATDGFYDEFSITEIGAPAVGIPNGDFETGSLNWTNTDAPEKFTITSDPNEVYEGNYALAIEAATQDWSNIKLTVPVNPFYRYRVSFYAKGESTTYFKVLNAAATVTLAGGIPSNTATDWRLNTYEFSSGSNENIVLYLADTAGAVYIDNFVLEELEAEPQIITEVANGDFETGDLTAWDTTYANGKFEVITVSSGSALSITSANQDWNFISQQISVEKGTNYRISLKAGGAGVYYKVMTTDWGKTFAEGTTLVTDITDMQLNSSSTFNTSNNEYILLVIYDTNGNALVDDVTISRATILPINGRPAVYATGSIMEIDLVDSEATDQTKSLFAYLKEVGEDNLLFGHQNDNYQTIVNKYGIASDTYHTVGAFPSVVGFDLIGFEGNPDELVDLIKDAYTKNSIITLCDHMPNLSSGGSFNDMTPTVEHILPGGKDNAAFLERLDMVAYVAEHSTDALGNRIPIIYRPFHENSGMWFWWGVSNSTKDQFINLWRYSVEYLRDVKGVDNFLYAYSPNGHFSSEADYLSRYPGDDYVDIIGFDVYHDNPSYSSKWMDQTKKDAQIAVTIANSKDKVAAITEVGLRYNGSDGLAVENNAVKDWYMLLHDTLMNDPVAKQVAYMMTWRNQDKSHFWVPYDNGEGDRHEMADEFTRFYNQDDVIFADRLGNVYDLIANTTEKETFAYIFAPITAEKIKGSAYQAKIKVVEGDTPVQSVIVILGETEYPAALSGEYYVASIDTTSFEDGDIAFSARVTLDNSQVIVLTKSIKVMNDDSNDTVDIRVLDNYDGYYGDTDLLRESYNRNTNGDLNAIELIESPFGTDLGYAMQFTYSVASGGPGYSGVSKTLNYNVSSLNPEGISLWIKGDGEGQDILLQMSMPDTFEVHFNSLDDFDQSSTEPQYLEIPWSAFVRKGHTNAMNLANVQAYAFYVNGTGVEDSILVFDEVKFLLPEDTPTPTVAPTSPTPTVAPTSPTPTVAPTSPTPTVAPTTPTPTRTPSTPTPIVENDQVGTGDSKVDLTYESNNVDGQIRLTVKVDASNQNDENEVITIPLVTSRVLENMSDDSSTGISITVEVSDDKLLLNDNKLNLKLDDELLSIASEKEKDISITVKDQNGNERYTWTFDGTDLKNSKQKLQDVNLSLKVDVIDNEKLGELLGTNSATPEEGNHILVDFAFDGILPSQASVRIYLGDQTDIKAGDKIYLYHLNEKTGKLETLPYSSGYVVDENGYITLNVLHCSDYVISSIEADAKLYTSLRKQIKVTPGKKTLNIDKNNTTNIILELPPTLELVKSKNSKTSSSAIGAVTVTYSSANKKVVKVDKNGKITAVGKGKTVVETTITLYSGKTKTFTSVITVK